MNGGSRPTIPAAKDGIGPESRSACARLTGKAKDAGPDQRSPVPRSGERFGAGRRLSGVEGAS